MKLFFFLFMFCSLSIAAANGSSYKFVRFDFSQVGNEPLIERYQLRFIDACNRSTVLDSKNGAYQYRIFRNGQYFVELVEVLASACSPSVAVSDSQVLYRANLSEMVTGLQNEYVLSIECR